MGITVTGIDSAIKELQLAAQKAQKEIITRLSYIGQKVVDGIKDGSLSNWNDVTGNLRSSIGYCVLNNGVIVEKSGFRVEKEGVEGVANGKYYLDSIISLFPSGYALIVVAGMDYASYVESIENKSVLARGDIEAHRLVEEMVTQLNRKKD